MGDDATAGSSLLQTDTQNFHRDHPQHHINRAGHVHHAAHRRQVTTAADTLVTTTVGVVKQVEVDSSGSTIDIEIITQSASNDKSPSTPGPVAALLASSTSSSAGSVYSGVPITSISHSLSTSETLVATSPTLTAAKPAISPNSTTPTESLKSTIGGNLVSNFTLSSTLSALKSKTDSIHTSTVFSTSSTTARYSYVPASLIYTTDSAGHTIVVGGSATASENSPASTSNPAATSNGSGNSSTPPTPILVGGIVGGMAGVAFVLLVAVFLFRWKKRNRNPLSILKGDGSGTEAIVGGHGGGPEGMTERSIPFAIPAALASLTGRNKSEAASSTAVSEQGFYRVSGRKLPSVLQSGGDGYGGEAEDRQMFSGPDTLSGSSFYRDSQGFHGGPGISLPDRNSGIIIMRPSPARTPVTQEGPFSPPPLQSPFDSAPPSLRVRPDGLGRSHPSQDGSHTSRFTEDLV